MANQAKAALILVDIQNDFCPGGNLAVPDGDAIVVLANQLQPLFHLVVATQDWHPADHKSFASNNTGCKVGDVIHLNGVSQVLWPDHCVQNTVGAKFHPQLQTDRINKIVFKGADREIDSYSAFYDNAHLRSTGLADYLHEHGVENVFILGLATDYCVKFSCLDAVKLKFNVFMIEDACRGIDLQAGDIAQAVHELRACGVKIIKVTEVADYI